MIEGVAAIAGAVREKKISARQICDEYLRRARADDLGCFYRLDEAGAREQARIVDEKIARGEDPGLLAGVPVGLKDLFVTKGVETTAGSKILEGWVPPYDGTPARKLRDAGAILVGKCSMDEFAMGSSNENSAYGPVRNPWDRARVPGGSSGGSAAAVAAGLVAGALGTDTGGSIRQPAALCGVTGMKPTYGRVSRYGVVAFASSLDQVGPFGRDALDVAHLLEAIAGHDPHDSTSLPHPVPRYRDACTRPLDGIRIGFAYRWLAGIDASVAKAIFDALKILTGGNHVLVDPKHIDYGIAAYYLIATAEASSNLARYDGIRYGLRVDGDNLNAMYARTRDAGFGNEAKRRIMLGTYALRAGYYDAYYGKAQKVRTLIRRGFADVFKECDVIVAPTTPTTAFKLGEKVNDPLQMYLEDVFTIPVNLAGLPGMSIPCGFVDGLPVGMQLIGPPLGEETLFAVAGAFQRETNWHKERPPS